MAKNDRLHKIVRDVINEITYQKAYDIYDKSADMWMDIKDAAEELYDKVRMYTDMNGINNAPLNTIRDFSEKIYDIASKKHEQASRGYKKLSDEIDMDAAYNDPEMEDKIPEDQDLRYLRNKFGT